MPIIGRPWDEGVHAIELSGEPVDATGTPWGIDQIAIILELLLR